MGLVGRRNKIALVIGEKKAAANKEVVVPAVKKTLSKGMLTPGKVSE